MSTFDTQLCILLGALTAGGLFGCCLFGWGRR